MVKKEKKSDELKEKELHLKLNFEKKKEKFSTRHSHLLNNSFRHATDPHSYPKPSSRHRDLIANLYVHKIT